LTVLVQEVGQVKNTQAQVKWYPCAGINSNVCHLEHRTVSIIKYMVKAVHCLILHFFSKTNFKIIIVHASPADLMLCHHLLFTKILSAVLTLCYP